MYVLLTLAVILLGVLVYAADRVVRARARARRRREARVRLAYAAARAEVAARQRRAEQEARAALTSVIPGIHDHGPRKVA